MIHIRIELWPGGQRNHPRACVLAEAEIENVGGTHTTGTYRYRIFGKKRRLMKSGEVGGYKRIAHHTWVLIRMVINHAFVVSPPG